MEFVGFVYGSITIALLIAHIDDYMKTWPRRPFTMRRSSSSTPDTASPSTELP